MNSALKHSATPSSNPLGIIALFVFFIEAIATVSLGLAVRTPYVQHLVWFIIAYPTLIAVAFFFILWFKREAFYTPSDFKDDTTFRDLLRRVQVIDAKQDVAILGQSGDLNDVFRTVDRLILLGDIFAAVNVGRAYLKADNYQTCVQVFDHISHKVERSDDAFYKILANRAYARIGIADYDQAIRDLEEVRVIHDGRHFRAWHAVALAFAYFKKGEIDRYKDWLSTAMKTEGYLHSRTFLGTLYPEIQHDLRWLGSNPSLRDSRSNASGSS